MGWGELKRDLGFVAGLFRRRPSSVLLEVTNRCNMRCAFCGFWSNAAPPDEELTLDEYRRVETELSGLNTFLVSIEGGEPLLRPDLVEIVRAFGARHLPILYTNGWHVDRRIAEDLFGAGLVQVGVSIDYPDAERHDRMRGLPGGFERAWRAVEALRDAAPRGGRQVHVMTILMEENRDGVEALLRRSAEAEVGHCLTLLSRKGFPRANRDGGPRPVSPPVTDWLTGLWKRHRHMRFHQSYLALMDSFLTGGEMPACRAGLQEFNIDHLGNVSPCLDKIDLLVGNVRNEPLAKIYPRLAKLEEVRSCQDCWTLCRACCQFMGAGASVRDWKDTVTRMRSW
jgi:MoaA/NifB/PqqE/SkfB family radical SAM enzyme